MGARNDNLHLMDKVCELRRH